MRYRRAVMPRRMARRQHPAGPLATIQSWFAAARIHPTRASLHLLILSLGLAVVLAPALANQPAISSAGDSNSASPQTLMGSESAESTATVAEEAAPQLVTYVVEHGDTLMSLSDRFGVSVATIVAANKLPDPDVIKVGQELTMLPTSGLLHTISPGETLGQVATRYGIAANELASANLLAPLPEQPVFGQKLVVPGIEPALPDAKPKLAVARTGASNGSPQAAEAQRSSSFASLSLQLGGGEGEVAGPAEAKAKALADAADAPSQAKPPLSYVVQEGDSVRSLADQFGVSIKTIMVANDLDDPDMIKVGTKLKVLPVTGVEHEVGRGEGLADIAAAYRVDMGPIIDFNGLADPDVLKVGDKILIPGATARVAVATVPAPAPRIASNAPAAAVAALPATQSSAQAMTRPATQSAAASLAIPAAVVGGGGGGLVANAMKYLGYRYVFGGTSPAGFDCSGFVWYVHKISGIDVSRGMWGQLNGGARISLGNLLPGDTVFFANTYMAGLSHDGIYIGGGQFIHAIDESQGVAISSLNSGYWAAHYVGATRIR